VCRSRGLASTIVSRAALAAETNNNSDTQTPKKTHPASSAADGTVLKGLNIYKSGQDPVALKDEEYPDWLWTLLDKVPFEEKSEIEQQRLNRSKAIKEANFMKGRK
ncbi:mitochondrial translation, partial [Coemansia erecta]